MKLDDIRKLENGWDGQNAKAPDPETLNLAANIGGMTGAHFSDYPEYVPCEDGSVQVEWHVDGWDVELWVSRAGV